MKLKQFSLCIISSLFMLAQDQYPPEKVMDTVRTPLMDMIRLNTGIELLGNKTLAEMGYVDVTATPFSADSTGSRDCTKALQDAIDFACTNQLACFFPAGIYIVSDTLSCVQPIYRRQNGKLGSADKFGNVLVGSQKDLGKRALLRLAPYSPGFDDSLNPKVFVHFWTRDGSKNGKENPPSGNVSFNQLFVGIDLAIGEGNSGAIAIRHRAAQGSSIQDVTIDATFGLKGLEGGAGSGGSHHRVTIIGGEIGADMTESQPAPTISGFRFINQKKQALIYSGMETLSIVGCSFKNEGVGPLIVGFSKNNIPSEGLITIVDSQFEFVRDGNNTVIQTTRSLFLQNVFVKNASILVDTPSQKIQGFSGWNQINKLAISINPPPFLERQYRCAAIVNGKSFDLYTNVIFGEPSTDLLSRHYWKECPTFESSGIANVKDREWGVWGDGVHDDTEAIQKVINSQEKIFFPKGIYHITHSLFLKPRTQLIGVAAHLSVLAIYKGDPLFSNPEKRIPMIVTADNAQASTTLAFLGMYAPLNGCNGFSFLEWRSGGDSQIRSCAAMMQPWIGYGYSGKREDNTDEYTGTLTQISGNGGGRWFNWFQEGHGLVYGRTEQDSRFRALLINETKQPLRFYQLNAEGTESEARIEFNQVQNCQIFGLKSEGNHPVLLAKNSSKFSIFGYGGNGTALSNSTLFNFVDCRDWLIANAMPRPAKTGTKLLGNSVTRDPNEWTLLVDVVKNIDQSYIRALDRPVLYQQGNP